MSGICGWIGDELAGRGADRELEAMALRLAFHESIRNRQACNGKAAAAVASHRETVTIHSDSEFLVAIEGMPRWDGRPATAREIAEAYREKGEEVLDRLGGPFCLAVLHADGSQALLAADRIGIQPLYYARVQEGLLFGSSVAAVAAHPDAPSEIDSQAIYDYLYFCQVPSPRTARKGCHRLRPGERIRLRDGRVDSRIYWRPSFRDFAPSDFEALAKEFRDVLRSSVADSADGEVGAFLSGGTDSSTVSGLLGEVRSEPARTFSIGFKAEGYDETGYAELASKHFGTRLNVYYVTPEDVVEAVPHIAAAYAEPFGNESAVPAYYCAKMAREQGVERLLAGDGGDELFAGNTRYAKQHVFARYEWLPSWLRKGLCEPLLDHFPAGERIWPVRKARSYIRQANVAMPDRMETYNLLDRFGPETVFAPEFLAGVNTSEPLELLRETYRSVEAETMLSRMLALDWKFTLADNDLVKVGRMCELAGIEVAFPLLSDQLVEFSTKVPASLKLKPLRLRYFFKRALRDYLPEAILKKSKHGFGLPFGVWLASHAGLRDLARESLDGLRTRGVVRPEFLDEIVEIHRGGAEGYYGVMIWQFLMLEQWFRAHVDARTN